MLGDRNFVTVPQKTGCPSGQKGVARKQGYSLTIIGLLGLCLIPLVLANSVGPLKGRDKLVGGPVSDARDDYVVFRLDRAHANSVESIPFFMAPAILAMMVGVGSGYLAKLG